jgi:KaiC/GvpD/RAD55 family RecA-like ATPase
MIRNMSYPQIRVEPGSLIVVIGHPGSGKSTFLGKLLAGMKGSRLYVPMDETGTAVLARMKRFGLYPQYQGIHVGNNWCDEEALFSMCEHDKFKHVVIDGMRDRVFDLRFFQKLFSRFKLRTIAVTLPATKTKLVSAKMRTLYHDADVAVRCGPTKNKWNGDLGHWTLEKNRYGKLIREKI